MALFICTGQTASHSTIRHAYELRVAVERMTVWPGEYVEVSIPTDMSSLDGSFALEVHVDASNVLPLATVFNLSLEEGIVPLEWKEANIIPLFKKGSFNTTRTNFRQMPSNRRK